eukprot:gene3218-13237_t
MSRRQLIGAPMRQSLDAGAFQRMVQTAEDEKVQHYPKKVVSTADATSASRNKWTEEDISSKTKVSFRKQVSRKLSKAKSVFKGFWGSKSKLKEEDECSEEDGNKKDEDGDKQDEVGTKQAEDSDGEGEGEDSVSLMLDSNRFSPVSELTRKPSTVSVNQIHGSGEVEASRFLRKSEPAAISSGDQSQRGRQPLPTASKSERRLSTTGGRMEHRMSSSYEPANMNIPPPQHHLHQGNWTGSPRVTGGAQGRAMSSSLVTDRSFKILPIEENQPQIAVQRSMTSVSGDSFSSTQPRGQLCQKHGMPRPSVRKEDSMPTFLPHNRRSSVCNPKSSRCSIECGGYGGGLYASMPDIHRSSQLEAPQPAGTSDASLWEISNFMDSFTDTLPMKPGQRSGRKSSCTFFGESDMSNVMGSFTDTQPMKAGQRGGRKSSCTFFGEGDMSNVMGSFTDTQPMKAGQRGGRKASCTSFGEGDMSNIMGSNTGTQPMKADQRGGRKASCTSFGEGDMSNIMGSNTGTQPMKVGLMGGRKTSCTSYGEGDMNNFMASFTDTQPMKAGSRGGRKMSCTSLVEGDMNNFMASFTVTQPMKAGSRGGRKTSCADSVDSQHAHLLHPPRAARLKPQFSTSTSTKDWSGAVAAVWYLGAQQGLPWCPSAYNQDNPPAKDPHPR